MKVHSLILITLMASVSLQADDKPKAKAKSTAGKTKAADQHEGGGVGGLESIGSLIQEGVRSTEVRNPGFDEGRRTSYVEAAAMTKLDAKRLFGEGVVIHLYGKEPKDNVRVELKTATYFLDTKMLASDDRSKVSRSDFQIEGDTMTFDSVTSHGQMHGHVHTIIFDTSALGGSKPKETPIPKAIPIAPSVAPTPDAAVIPSAK